MKQKIVMKVQINCQKCRTKALKIAACADGVISVAVEGDNRDKVVVTGDGVDPVILATDMRKKVGHTSIISVEEVKSKDEKKKPTIEQVDPFQWNYINYYHPHSKVYEYHYDDYPSCSIM